MDKLTPAEKAALREEILKMIAGLKADSGKAVEAAKVENNRLLQELLDRQKAP